MGFGCGNDFLVIDHPPQVDDIEIVAGQYDTDDVFTDIVYISFGSRKDNFRALNIFSRTGVVFFDLRL